jgi:predicted porin
MKKSLLALAALTAITGAAQAQSSVTLSGSIDLGLRRSNGAWQMVNSGSSRTSFTLSGTEDLGGGNSAFFAMNHRFHANSGIQRDSNAFWRQAWVGLRGGFGSLRLGKILPPLQDLNGNFEPWSGSDFAGTHTGGLFSGKSAFGSRYANTIYYNSPSLGGLALHASISAADQNSELSALGGGSERPVGLGLDYSAGPLRVAAAYDRNADDKKTKGVYGSFNFGFASLMAQYEKGDIYLASPSDVGRWSVGLKGTAGQWVWKAGYTKWSDEDVKKFAFGGEYVLSKRTNLYADVGKLSGDGLAGTPAGALSDANRKTFFDLGIVHRF